MRRNRFSRVLTLAVVTMAALTLATSANAAPLWTPGEILYHGEQPQIWLDAADATTVTEASGLVSQWDDKSGFGRNAVQATGTDQPGYVLASQNGLNIMRLDGTSQHFDLGTGLDWMAANADHTAFVVLKNDNYANIYGAAEASGANDARLHVGFQNSNNYRMNRWANDWGTPITANYNAGAYNFLRFGWDEGGQKYVFANAKKEGDSGTHSATGLSAMAGGGSIGNVVAQGLLDADIGEFVILNTAAATQDTVDRMEGYLAWKWGLEASLPSGHAYKSAAPEAEFPAGGDGYFGIREVIGNGTIDSLSATVTSLMSGTGTIVDGTAPVINFHDSEGGGSTGDVGGDLSYLSNTAASDDDFVQIANGTIRIDTPGTYTFYAHGDDGFQLEIEGGTFSSISNSGDGTAEISGDMMFNDSLGGNVNGFGVIDLEAGDYNLEYLFFERTGGAYNELFAAAGTFTTYNSTDFHLIGDVLNGGLPLVAQAAAGVPEPSTFALATLGLLGLAFCGWRRRRRAAV